VQNSLMTIEQLKSLPTSPGIDLGCLVRGEPQELNSFLGELEVDIPFQGSLAKGHAYFILSDGNGRPRIDAFAQSLVNLVTEYAIPRSKINEAFVEYERTKSPYAINALNRDAKNLFTELLKSGEGGELLLFWFAERILKLPQIICKMSLKTNSNMHIHGSDGIHADVDPEDGLLRLYWCESKIYASVNQAVTSALNGIYNFLASPFSFGGTQDNDIRLLGDLSDLGDERINDALKQFLDPQNPSFCSVKNCAICLVGGTSPSYANTSGTPQEILSQINESLRIELPRWLKHTNKKLKELKVEEFIIHIIYLPFPDADEFRAKFKAALVGVSHDEA